MLSIVSKSPFCVLLRRPLIILNIRLLHMKTHYETLKLPRNCSPKDIKDAFIKLSKEYHPDTNTKNSSHTEYVKIVEAYSVLSKAASRKQYDLSLGSSPRMHSQGFQSQTYARRPEYQYPPFRENFRRQEWRTRNDRMRQDYYYDLHSRFYPPRRTRTKFSNVGVATMAILFTLLGVGLQLMAIKHSYAIKRHHAITNSYETELLLREISDRISREGYDMRIERLEKELDNIEDEKNE